MVEEVLTAVGDGKALSGDFTLPPPTVPDAPAEYAAWVTRRGALVLDQAVGGAPYPPI